MPEESHAGLAEPDPTAISTSGSVPAVRCVELHCKTNFSFLEGASHPEELIDQAGGWVTPGWPSPTGTAWPESFVPTSPPGRSASS